MNKNRLSEKIEAALNAQMTKEALAAQIYLSFGAWAQHEGYAGTSNFLFKHAEEERDHMMKLLEYILKRGGNVNVTAIAAPVENPENINNCFELIFKHETDNTKEIYKIVKLSMLEEDWATLNFMQWFVQEQIEEENMAQNLLDKIKLAGGNKITGNALFILDKELEKMPNDIKPAQNITAENP